MQLDRVRLLNSVPVPADAQYVLYWAQMNRPVEANHALALAAYLANQLRLPLLVYEELDCCHPHANDRFHTFLLEAVPETEKRLARLGVGYVFHLRRRRSDPNDTLYRITRRAAALVTDDYPVFLARSYNTSPPAKLDIPYYVVDSSCTVPMSRLEKREYAAYTIRPRIRRMLPAHLQPVELEPLARRFDLPLPGWHTSVTASNIAELVSASEIDHSVPPSTAFRGGRAEAEARLRLFLAERLRRYARDRNQPTAHATSNLSPYLHFGHISSLETALAARDYAAQHKLIAEEFLDELIVRRELAFNFARFTERPDTLENLPAWALATLRKHAGDPRSPVYVREQFECARTHDALWNAAQNELLLRGTIHGYYRMYWGKKIIEWSPTHQDALETMVYLHDRYALDGRDPNTYANILWCFGLHDRPWAERPVFGTVRYMSGDSMRRRTDVAAYLREIEALGGTGADPVRLQ